MEIVGVGVRLEKKQKLFIAIVKNVKNVSQECRACGRFGAPSNASMTSANRSEIVFSPVLEGAEFT